jgi:Tfp pilus assembly protein PilF
MVERVPGSARAQMLAGEIAMANGNLGAAVEHLERSASIAPDIAQSLAILGAAYLQQGRVAEAKRTLEKAFSLEPNDMTAITNLARIYAREGQWDAAERLYPMAIQTQPRNYGLRRDYGLLLEERGKMAEAIEQLETILPREGLRDDELVVFALARAHLKLGNREQGERFLRRTLGANPANERARTMLQELGA